MVVSGLPVGLSVVGGGSENYHHHFIHILCQHIHVVPTNTCMIGSSIFVHAMGINLYYYYIRESMIICLRPLMKVFLLYTRIIHWFLMIDIEPE